MKKITDILTVKTTKWICHSCHRSYITSPNYQGLDKGDECQCGNTSFISKKGRPIGRKSYKWDKEIIEFTLNNMPNLHQYFIFKK